MNAQHLKSSVLQYAMQGKLVPQDANDEPASALFSRIQEAKKRLIQEKVIKNNKALPPLSDDKVPFDIPNNWKWVRLGDITSKITDGVHKTPQYLNDGVPFLSVKNISKGYLDMSDIKYVSKDAHEEMIKRCNPEKGDILFCRIGTLGKPLMIKEDVEFSIFVSLGLLKIIDKSIAPFVELAMKSPVFYDQINEVKVSGSHTNKINLRDVPDLLIPLPPLEEQERIINKLESMNNKIEQFDSNHQELNSLKRNFPTKLENSILHYAMEGKLVEQEAGDESVADLVKCIREEKKRLIEEKIIKKEKALAPISDEEVPFDIPVNWEWIRIGDLCEKIGSGSTPKGGKAVYKEEGIKFLRSQNVYNDGLRMERIVYISDDQNKQGSIVKPKDILLNITGGSIGRCALVPDDFDTANVNQHVMIIRNIVPENRLFLHYVLISPYVQSLIRNAQVGVSREGLSAEKLKSFLIPLPPLEEQKRIVAKIDDSMAVIKKLESSF